MGKRRFQQGQLWLNKGARSRAWYLRYRDVCGKRPLHVLGSIDELPTKGAARARAAEFLAPINGGRRTTGPLTVGELIARYRREEMPERLSTRASYSSLLSRWIEPRWGDALLSEVRATDVEAWMKGLDRSPGKDGKPRPLAPKTKANLRQLFHVLFEDARRWEMHAGDNPIGLVRQSAKKTRPLAKLSVVQYQRIVATMVEPHRTMVLIAGCLGLRIGEILGLRWGDVDFGAKLLHVRRDVYQGQIDEVKSESSARALPVPQMVLDSLATWRPNAFYQAERAYIFAQGNGRPMWADTLRESILQPVAAPIGAGKIGWHAFRHLFASVLQVVGAEQIVAKELMGHADVATTASYQYGFDERRRAATDGVASLLLVQ